MPETTPLIKAELNLRVGAGFDVYGRSGKGTSELVNPITKYDGMEYSSVYTYQYYLNQNPEVKNYVGKMT